MPRLPVPSLYDSVRKYVAAIEALEGHPKISAIDVARARKVAQDFLKNDGAKLHQLLLEYDSRNSNSFYIYKLWTDNYLKDRRPLPMTHNLSIVWTLHKNRR